jgi:hypothetical protein
MDFRHPSRSQQNRTRREDRHLNFYIARDMLQTLLELDYKAETQQAYEVGWYAGGNCWQLASSLRPGGLSERQAPPLLPACRRPYAA